jgi:hypothetical protein
MDLKKPKLMKLALTELLVRLSAYIFYTLHNNRAIELNIVALLTLITVALIIIILMLPGRVTNSSKEMQRLGDSMHKLFSALIILFIWGISFYIINIADKG